MLGEVLKPEQGRALAGKDGRDPAEGVVEVPDGDADAAADLDARANGLDSNVSIMDVENLEKGEGNSHSCRPPSAGQGLAQCRWSAYGHQAR